VIHPGSMCGHRYDQKRLYRPRMQALLIQIVGLQMDSSFSTRGSSGVCPRSNRGQTEISTEVYNDLGGTLLHHRSRRVRG
jgi:hypothetical protein